TSGNNGGAYRSGDVDIEASGEGGYDIGWTAAGEWLNYTVNVGSSGNYTAQLRVASPNGASMHTGFNGPSSVWNSVSSPATGGWSGTGFSANVYQGTDGLSTYPLTVWSWKLSAYADCWASARVGLGATLNVRGTPVEVFGTHLQTGGCGNDAQLRYNSMGDF